MTHESLGGRYAVTSKSLGVGCAVTSNSLGGRYAVTSNSLGVG